MSRNRRRKNKANDAASTGGDVGIVAQGPAVSTFDVLMRDTFMNQFARLGYGTNNYIQGTSYVNTRLSHNYNLMNTLYRSNWIARRVIKCIPQDMMKNWISYQCELTPEQIDLIVKNEKATKIKRSLLHGLCWGRLYGGAVAVILIDGQEDELDTPLNLDSIYPGDFKGLLIADRWSGVFPSMEIVSDINDPEFGLPQYYDFKSNTMGMEVFSAKVHHSRIIRFTGADLPDWERLAEMGWGASIIESVYTEIAKRDNTSENLANLLFLANLRVMKMGDLGDAVGGLNNTKATQDLYNRMQAMSQLQSNFGTMVMNKDDDFQQFALTNFSGINDIYESFMLDVSGAAEIPVTKLFGRSPAGFNSTGEGDMRNYFDTVEQEQQAQLLPALEKLLPILCMSSIGFVPDDFDFHFNPIETPTEDKIAENVQKKTESILAVHDRGIISDQVALKELKTISEGTGIFTNITDNDIASANTNADPLLPENPDSEEEEPSF